MPDTRMSWLAWLALGGLLGSGVSLAVVLLRERLIRRKKLEDASDSCANWRDEGHRE